MGGMVFQEIRGKEKFRGILVNLKACVNLDNFQLFHLCAILYFCPGRDWQVVDKS